MFAVRIRRSKARRPLRISVLALLCLLLGGGCSPLAQESALPEQSYGASKPERRTEGKPSVEAAPISLQEIRAFVGIPDIQAQLSPEQSFSVAILDTGVFPHDSLAERIIAFKDYLYQKPKPYDDEGHGTQIAGIIAARQDESVGSGLAPFVNIVAVKVLDHRRKGKTEDIVEALAYVLENSERYQVKVINFSIGFPSDTNEALEALFEQAAQKNIVIVSSVGNEATGAHYSGIDSTHIILVGSAEFQENRNAFEVADYSHEIIDEQGNYRPDIYTFGTNICTIDSNVNYKGNQNEKIHYADRDTVVTGSSFSAAIVTGYICQLFRENPSLTLEQVRDRLLTSDVFTSSKNGEYLIPILTKRTQ